MTAKHSHPQYLANAKLVRAQVHRAWRNGDDVRCWRCPRILEPGAPFDVGHLDPDGGHGRENLAPECRPCNRGEGGRRGAAITNARRAARTAMTAPRPARPVVRPARLAPW